MADNSQVIEQLIDNLNTVVGTLAKDGDKFSGAVDRFEQLVTGLSAGPRSDRHGDHLAGQRHRVAGRSADPGPPAAGRHRSTSSTGWRRCSIEGNDQLDVGHCRRRRRTTASWPGSGAYGSCIKYYICGISLRVTDLQGRTAVFPWIKQDDRKVRGA